MPRSRQSLILTEWSMQSEGDSHVQLIIILNILCELGSDEKVLVDDIGPYYHAAEFRPGEPIFLKNGQPEAFYIVLQGYVAVPEERKGHHKRIISGAGEAIQLSARNPFGVNEVGHFHKVGGIFEYCDYLLNRYRTFQAEATEKDGAMVAVFARASIDKMKDENYPRYLIVQKLLLRASLNDLANCTCYN